MKTTGVFTSYCSGLLGPCALGLLLVSVTSVSGQLIIDLPDVTLQPNTPGQTFDVVVQNPGASRSDITGIQFNIQTTDGGPSVGGVTPAPSITDVDLTTGALFANNNGYSGPGQQGPQIFVRGTLTSQGTVTIPTGLPHTKIATVEIDTTGFASGVYSITLDTLNGPTRFTSTSGNVFPVLFDGSITVVPEPNACVVIAGFLAAFAGVRGWKRRAL